MVSALGSKEKIFVSKYLTWECKIEQKGADKYDIISEELKSVISEKQIFVLWVFNGGERCRQI